MFSVYEQCDGAGPNRVRHNECKSFGVTFVFDALLREPLAILYCLPPSTMNNSRHERGRVLYKGIKYVFAIAEFSNSHR